MQLTDLQDPNSLLSRALEDLRRQIEMELARRFHPHRHDDERTYLYGVYRVTSRVKGYSSVDRKRRSEPARYSEMAEDVDIYALTRWMTDLIAVRIVLLSQRHKLIVQRAIDRLTTMNLRIALRPTEDAVRTRADGTRYPLWKYFNPPVAYLSSASYCVRRADEILDRISELSPPPSDESALTRSRTLELLDSVMRDSPYRMKHKVTGYATLQTNLSMELSPNVEDENPAPIYRPVTFEIQLRTLLEDAWAEPEHAMAYKGSLDEDTCNLMRNLGAQLHAADDLLQQVVDRFLSVYERQAAPYAQMSLNYQSRFESDPRLAGETYKGFALDYSKLHRLSEAGRYGDAYKHCARMIEKYSAMDDTVLASYIANLNLEMALICLYWRESHLLREAQEICRNCLMNPDSSLRNRFWSRFRLSQIDMAIAETDIRKGTIPSDEMLRIVLSVTDSAVKLATDADTPDFAATWAELITGNTTRGLRQDIYLWASRALRKLGRAYEAASLPDQAVSAYDNAMSWARRVVSYADNDPVDSVLQLTTYAQNGIAYCFYLKADLAGIDDAQRRSCIHSARTSLEQIKEFADVCLAVEQGRAAPRRIIRMNDRELMICDTIASIYHASASFEDTATAGSWRSGAMHVWELILEGLVRIELLGEVGRNDDFLQEVQSKFKGQPES
jgi:ppGpp synthetase/RelA/SpoT-type nucleotidyltranferase